MIKITIPHYIYSQNKIKIKNVIKKYGMSWDSGKNGWINGVTGDGVYIDKSIMDLILSDSFKPECPMVIFAESANKEFLSEFHIYLTSLGGTVETVNKEENTKDETKNVSPKDEPKQGSIKIEVKSESPIKKPIDVDFLNRKIDMVVHLTAIFFVSTVFLIISFICLGVGTSNNFIHNVGLICGYIFVIGYAIVAYIFLVIYYFKASSFVVKFAKRNYPKIANFFIKLYEKITKSKLYMEAKRLFPKNEKQATIYVVSIITIGYIAISFYTGTLQALMDNIGAGLGQALLGAWVIIGAGLLFRKKEKEP